MADFPELVPSGRIYTPGEYPHSPFMGMSGAQNRVRHSNVMRSSQLRLGFIAITEAEMLSILSHYQGQQGGFNSFNLPSDVWSGVSNTTDYQLTSYGWRYIEPPVVEDLTGGGHNVELVLESVPPEGTALAGMAKSVLSTFAGGIASPDGSVTTGGINQALAVSFNGGEVKALDGTIDGFNNILSISIIGGDGSGTAAENDPHFSSVLLLLHMDGADGSTAFADSSSNGYAIESYGGAAMQTSQSVFGSASLFADGTDDYLRTPIFTISTSEDFTWECWIRRPDDYTHNSVRGIMQLDSVFVALDTSAQLSLYTLNTKRLAIAGAIAPNEWVHVALVRSSNALYLYKNGVAGGASYAHSSALSNRFFIATSSQNKLRGNIDEARVTKGVARYTSNFTPPDAAFPNS